MSENWVTSPISKNESGVDHARDGWEAPTPRRPANNDLYPICMKNNGKNLNCFPVIAQNADRVRHFVHLLVRDSSMKQDNND